MRLMLPACGPALCLVLLAACGRDDTSLQVEPPGTRHTVTTSGLAGGASSLPAPAPIEALDVYVDGFHFYNGNVDMQVEAHHYCAVVDEDLQQCVIFDGNGAHAKLVGVEYIVSRRVFETLSADERKLWHSHAYAVKSGALIAPGVPDSAEHELMEDMVGTYGKTWNTWHADEDQDLPTGHPMLMAGFTADEQIRPDMIAERDERFRVSTDDERKLREDIQEPSIVAGADAWQRGEVLQLTLQARMAHTRPARKEPEAGRDDSTTEPTRQLRGTKVRQLYAALPSIDGDD
ncbi:MAG TPA: OBAP family protein [Steroidobacteraceae bacterium]